MLLFRSVRIAAFFIASLPFALTAMQRVAQAPDEVKQVPSLVQLALPKYFEYCNLKNIDAAAQTNFPKEKLLEIIQQSPWPWSTGNLVTLRRYASVTSAIFTPDSKRVIMLSGETYANVFGAQTGVNVGNSLEDDTHIMLVQMSPDGTKMATASFGNSVKIENYPTNKYVATITHNDRITSVQFSADSKKIITASQDRTVQVVNAQTGHVFFNLQHELPVSSASFSPDMTKIMTVSNALVKVFSAQTGALLFVIEHGQQVTSAEFSGDSKKIVTASKDTTAKVVDAQTGKILFTIYHDEAVDCARFSKNNALIVTTFGGVVGKLKLTDAVSEEIKYVRHIDAGLLDVQFSPDTTKLAVTAWRHNIAYIFDVVSGTLIARVNHDKAILSMCFSPDSRKIVTGSWDRSAKIYGLPQSDDELIRHLQTYAGTSRLMLHLKLAYTIGAGLLARLWYSDEGMLQA